MEKIVINPIFIYSLPALIFSSIFHSSWEVEFCMGMMKKISTCFSFLPRFPHCQTIENIFCFRKDNCELCIPKSWLFIRSSKFYRGMNPTWPKKNPTRQPCLIIYNLSKSKVKEKDKQGMDVTWIHQRFQIAS